MLSERDYMNRFPDEREDNQNLTKKETMQRELFKLYGKKDKTFMDKLKIKKIEITFRHFL